jgi:hypothetical protein
MKWQIAYLLSIPISLYFGVDRVDSERVSEFNPTSFIQGSLFVRNSYQRQ